MHGPIDRTLLTPHRYKPNAFGGAQIDDPYECMARYQDILKTDERVDLVLPLCHLCTSTPAVSSVPPHCVGLTSTACGARVAHTADVPQDKVLCERFDVPLVIGGHDHHIVDLVHKGTRVVKPGCNADNALIVDITWKSGAPACKPDIRVQLVAVGDYAPDPELQVAVDKAYVAYVLARDAAVGSHKGSLAHVLHEPCPWAATSPSNT